MRIVFGLRHGLYVRNYESVIRALAASGHTVELAFSVRVDHLEVDDRILARDLASALPGVTFGELPARRDAWSALSRRTRALRDYLRYFAPAFRQATALRERAGRRVAAPVRWIAAALSPALKHGLDRLLAAVETVVPSDPRLERDLRARRPDVLVLSPLVDLESPQVDTLQSARRLGIPTVLAVASWDNLTNKGRVHLDPDRVLVWNDWQKREAIELHGIPAHRIAVTGAQLFDEWFTRTPSTSREEFCRRVGLGPERPFFLYLCSSRFIAPDEVTSVRRWIEAVRSASDPELARAGVLIRPHPAHAEQWSEVDLSALGNTTIWPRAGAHPVDAASKRDYFDSLFHAHAAVGINTSGLIEAGIVGRRCHTLLSPEYARAQGQTLHFAMLVEGGLLRVARSIAEQLGQLGDGLREPAHATGVQAFLNGFIRPQGVDRDATTEVVTELLELPHRYRHRPAETRESSGWRLLLWPVACALRSVDGLREQVKSWVRGRPARRPVEERHESVPERT